MIHLAISCATCIATKLPDMLRDKLHSVTAPVYRTRRCVCKRQHESVTPSSFCFTFYSLFKEYFNKTFTKHVFVILSFLKALDYIAEPVSTT